MLFIMIYHCFYQVLREFLCSLAVKTDSQIAVSLDLIYFRKPQNESFGLISSLKKTTVFWVKRTGSKIFAT